MAKQPHTRTKPPATATEATEERRRLQVLCSREQEDIITQAAKAAGFEKDRSAWILAQALKAAKAAAAGPGAPLTIAGALADQVRAAAAAQGVDPEKWLRLQVA